MIRRVTFYWLVLTLILVDSWLLSKPNILGKIGLIIYKYHYLRSFPRTLLTVWTVVSISILIVLLVQYLQRQKKLTRGVSNLILGACLCASLLIIAKVYIDFTSWSYSHTGLKFRYGAYLLPTILMIIFANGLVQLQRSANARQEGSSIPPGDILQIQEASPSFSSDTSQL
jgi:hypothetical protein